MLAVESVRRALSVAGLLAASTAAALPAPDSFQIGGVYCGTALSGGRLVEVHTMLAEQDGLLSGSYDFADHGETTSGELQESIVQSRRSRTLVWTDKYGTGLVTFDFDETGDSFVGRWGFDLRVPTMQWDGKRCETPTA